MERLADLTLRWHLVGHLQSNKAKKAAEHFHAIHALDGAALGHTIEQAARAADRRVEVLVQVAAAFGIRPTQLGGAHSVPAG